MKTSKQVWLYSPLPFPYICKNENDPSKWKKLLSSSPANGSYSAQSFSVSKCISSCFLTCMGKITLTLPLEIWVTLRSHKWCKRSVIIQTPDCTRVVGAHVHIVISDLGVLSSMTHTETLQLAKNLQYWLKTYFLKGVHLHLLRPLDPPLKGGGY